jgi:prepilin peptidase CpaA
MSMISISHLAYLPLAGGLIWAAIGDLRTRRIPNVLCVTLLVMGLLLQFVTSGLGGLADGVLGAVVGFALLFPFYALGGFAAGDVKLMAAACAWLNLKLALVAVGATLLIGGAMGLAVAAWVLLFRASLSPAVIAGSAMTAPRALLAQIRGTRFPYALAIAAGVACAVFWGKELLS